MKKILVLVSASTLILFLGYYFYTATLSPPASKSLWDLVPAEAVIIYENKKPLEIKKTNSRLVALLQATLKQDSVFVAEMKSSEMIVSFHVAGKEDFGIIYYLPDSAILKHPFLKELTTPSGKRKKRIFEGYTINELVPSKESVLSWTTLDRNLVISRQSLLIEDVIRSAKAEEKKSIRKNNKELFQSVPAEFGQGNLYVNLSQVSKFCSLFIPREIKSSFFQNLGSSLLTGIKIENQTLSMNGFATDSAILRFSALSLFNDQHPVASEIHKIVSNRALFCIHYGIPDFNLWAQRRENYRKTHDTGSLKLPEKLQTQFNPADFYNALGDEIGSCRLENAGRIEDILIVETRNTAKDKLTALLSNDLPPIETYANYPIHKLAVRELICSLLWPLTENRNLNFYFRYNKYLLFSENLESLKKCIDDMEEDNTWGKSADWNSFFGSTSPESNVGFVFNGTLLFPWLLNELTPQWNSTVGSTDWNTLRKGSFQFTRLDRNYDFNGVIQFDVGKKTPRTTSKNSVTPELSFPEPIVYLSSAKNRGDELLVQTNDNVLHLISPDFKVHLQVNLQDKIRGEVHQIDFYKNKKLQYVFIAGRRLYLIDRLGNPVTGFPRTIASPADLEFLSIVDYDNSRNYRFLMADEKGNLYMMDKEGKLLRGWDTKASGIRFFSAPRQVRTAGKDFIVGMDGRGSVLVFNRKGEMMKGFPANLSLKPGGDWFFEKSNSLEDAWITVVSTEGIKAQINLNGQLANKENFIRSSPYSKFSLAPSTSLGDYVVSRVDNGKVAILNAKGKILFEKENPGSDALEVRYLESGTGRKLFCFRDVQQDFTYVFQEQGNPVFTRPLETTLMPVVKKSGERLTVFTVYKNKLKKVFE